MMLNHFNELPTTLCWLIKADFGFACEMNFVRLSSVFFVIFAAGLGRAGDYVFLLFVKDGRKNMSALVFH